MIDIHTHILPCLDDGAQEVEASLAMLQTEKAQGVETVVFTPHYYGRISPEQFVADRKTALERLVGGIPEGLQTRLGAEVHFTGVNVPDYESLCLLAIEGTRYILLEFPFTADWDGELLGKLADFIYETGYTPIIAHVERYHEVAKNPAIVTELVNMGCLIQVNASSFLDKWEKKLAFALMKHGLVHCIGSDAHDTLTRTPDMTAAKTAIFAAGYVAEWESSQENMRRVLANEKVAVSAEKPVKKIWGKYF